MALIIDGTNGLTVPSWTSNTRPGAAQTGQFGFNTTLNMVEVYTSGGWASTGTSNNSTYAVTALILAGGGGGGGCGVTYSAGAGGGAGGLLYANTTSV